MVCNVSTCWWYTSQIRLVVPECTNINDWNCKKDYIAKMLMTGPDYNAERCTLIHSTEQHLVVKGNTTTPTRVCIHNILKASVHHIHPQFEYDSNKYFENRCVIWCFILPVQTKYMGKFKEMKNVHIVHGLRLLSP